MVTIKSEKEIQMMAEGGKILAEILQKIAEAVKPGISTQELDNFARKLCDDRKVKPAFLGYQDYPAALCVSINDEVVHGIPSPERILNEGDVVGLDMGIVYDGLNTDSAITVVVHEERNYSQWAKENSRTAKLIEVTRTALNLGIGTARVGHTVGQISSIIQKTVEDAGFNVVRDLVGHGIGKNLHEDPQIPNFGNAKDGIVLKAGMTLAIEPMTVVGDWHLKIDPDKWTYRTVDGSVSAHFEHTIAITKDGPLILTVL